MPIAEKVRFCTSTQTHINIGYEEVGPQDGSVILFVPGLSATCRMYDSQMTALLAAKGYRVITMDNRDVGESTNGGEKNWPQPWLYGLLAPTWMSPKPIYTLEDMARDAWAFLDRLKVKQAHIAGFSMGSKITQWMMLQQPTRVLSLCCGTGTTGGTGLSVSPLWVRWQLLQAPPKDADLSTLIDWKAKHVQKIFIPPKDEETAKQDYKLLCEHIAKAQERITYRLGSLRQLYAIVHETPGLREGLLKQMTEEVPILVFHGKKDLIFPADHAERAVEVFGKKNTKLVMIANMGHFMESKFYQTFADAIDDMAQRGLKRARPSGTA